MFDVIAGNSAARRVLEAASAAADFDVVAAARNAADIFRNAVAQPLICAYEIAAWSALAPQLPTPLLFAGYSVGELAAYGCAGSLSAFDTVQLARQRAACMDAESEQPAGLTAVRGLSRGKTESLCSAVGTEIAIVNGEDHFIVGGHAALLDEFDARATAGGATVQRLSVGVAAHTSLLAAASGRFLRILEISPLTKPAIPVLAGVSGTLVNDRQAAIATLAQQLSNTVQWSTCLDTAYERGCRVFLELGPCNALARMVRERFPDVAARSLAEFRSLEGAADWVDKNA